METIIQWITFDYIFGLQIVMKNTSYHKKETRKNTHTKLIVNSLLERNFIKILISEVGKNNRVLVRRQGSSQKNPRKGQGIEEM